MIVFMQPTDKILKGLRGHAGNIRHVGEELLLQLQASHANGMFDTRLGGANSNYITMSNGHTWYLSGRPSKGLIEVKIWPNGRVMKRLATRQQVRDWVKSL